MSCSTHGNPYDNVPLLPERVIAVSDYVPLLQAMTIPQINCANQNTLYQQQQQQYNHSRQQYIMRPVNSNEAKRKEQLVKCASTHGGYKYRNKRKKHTRKHTRRKSIKRKRKN
jgi:hypothetical protein